MGGVNFGRVLCYRAAAMASGTAYVTDPRMLAHDPGAGHPERPDRLRVLQERVAAEPELVRLGAPGHVPPVSPWVERLTGHPARTYAAWAEEHAGDFR